MTSLGGETDAAASVTGVPIGGLQGARVEAMPAGGVGAGLTVGWAADGVGLTPLRLPNLARRAS